MASAAVNAPETGDLLAQSHSLLALDVYEPFETLDRSVIASNYLQGTEADEQELEAILAELHALKLQVMQQLYTFEQSLQAKQISALSHELMLVKERQMNAHWIKDTLSGLVTNLRKAFSSFFGGNRAASIEPESEHKSTKAAWLTPIVKPEADIDLEQVTQADREGSMADLDELEAILQAVDELFKQLMSEIVLAYWSLSGLEEQVLLEDMNALAAREAEQEQGRVAIVNFLELLRSTLDTLKHPGLVDPLAEPLEAA